MSDSGYFLDAVHTRAELYPARQSSYCSLPTQRHPTTRRRGLAHLVFSSWAQWVRTREQGSGGARFVLGSSPNESLSLSSGSHSWQVPRAEGVCARLTSVSLKLALMHNCACTIQHQDFGFTSACQLSKLVPLRESVCKSNITTLNNTFHNTKCTEVLE